MKKILLFAVVAATLSACSNYVCPTYSKQDIQKTEPVAEQNNI